MIGKQDLSNWYIVGKVQITDVIHEKYFLPTFLEINILEIYNYLRDETETWHINVISNNLDFRKKDSNTISSLTMSLFDIYELR